METILVSVLSKDGNLPVLLLLRDGNPVFHINILKEEKHGDFCTTFNYMNFNFDFHYLTFITSYVAKYLTFPYIFHNLISKFFPSTILLHFLYYKGMMV